MERSRGLERLLRKYRLEHQRSLVERGLQDAVRICCGPHPARIESGASRLGGEPDLHWSEPWPSQGGRPLHFLAQIRLADLAGRLRRSALPPRGRLTLWYNSLGEKKRGDRTVITAHFEPSLLHLMFDRDDTRVLQRRPWPAYREAFKHSTLDDWAPYPPTSVFFQPMRTLTRVSQKKLFKAEESADPEEGWNRCFEFLRELENAGNRYEGHHRLLGEVCEVQGDSQFSAACAAARVDEFAKRTRTQERRLRRMAARYRLLVMLDTDRRGPGFEWGDGGSLQWWIREDHLRARELELAVGIYEQGS
jgi:uncharacterized protein YwqG